MVVQLQAELLAEVGLRSGRVLSQPKHVSWTDAPPLKTTMPTTRPEADRVGKALMVSVIAAEAAWLGAAALLALRVVF